MNDSQLRAVIRAENLEGLARGKSRGKMIRLLKRWIDLWNANVDRPQRHTRDELREHLRVWFESLEQPVTRPNHTESNNGVRSELQTTSSRTEVARNNSKSDWEPSIHLVQYKEEFDQLIEEIKARKGMKKRRLEVEL
jgi:hypothetical protein